jgi:hypothetical protein
MPPRASRPTLAGTLDLGSEASDEEIAGRLATLAGKRQPETDATRTLWLSLAAAIEHQLIENPPMELDDGEAASYVVIQLLGAKDQGEWERTRQETWNQWSEALATDDVDEELRSFVAFEIAPRLAEAGCFRLV